MVFTDPHEPSSFEGSTFGFLYYFLINLVITSIVSGIIIETFAQMRSDKHEVDDNLVSSCFICDIEPEDFEQSGVKFSDHILADHNMWQYVWLKIYLRDKDKTSYSGTEMHVAPLFAKHSPKCMPIKRSRAMQGKVKDRATLPNLLRKINAISGYAESTDNALDDLKKKIEKLNDEVAEVKRSVRPVVGGETRSRVYSTAGMN